MLIFYIFSSAILLKNHKNLKNYCNYASLALIYHELDNESSQMPHPNVLHFFSIYSVTVFAQHMFSYNMDDIISF